MSRTTTSPPLSAEDEALLTRMRDLALVDLDALLAGAAGDQYALLLIAHAEDVEDALRAARTRMNDLAKAVGSDPLVLLDAGFASRAQGGGREAAERVAGGGGGPAPPGRPGPVGAGAGAHRRPGRQPGAAAGRGRPPQGLAGNLTALEAVSALSSPLRAGLMRVAAPRRLLRSQGLGVGEAVTAKADRTRR